MSRYRGPASHLQHSPAREQGEKKHLPRKKMVGDPTHAFIKGMQKIMDERQELKELIIKLRVNVGLFSNAGNINPRFIDPKKFADLRECIRDKHMNVERALDGGRLRRILEGTHLPSDVELRRFALSYGIAGKQCADFVEQGLEYVAECKKQKTHQAPAARENIVETKAAVPRAPAGNAGLSDVLKELIALRKVYKDTKHRVDPAHPRRAEIIPMNPTMLRLNYGLPDKAGDLISGKRPQIRPGGNLSLTVSNDIEESLPHLLDIIQADAAETARVYEAYLQTLLDRGVSIDNPALGPVMAKLESTERPAQGPHTAALANQKNDNARSR